MARLQPCGCTKQLNDVEAGWPLARLAGCRPFACASENHAFPTSAFLSDEITLLRAVLVHWQLDARAAVRQSPPGPIHCKSRAAPGANQTDEVGNRGAGVRCGILVPTVVALSDALVPGVPQFGGRAPRYGRQVPLGEGQEMIYPWTDLSPRCRKMGGWWRVVFGHQSEDRVMEDSVRLLRVVASARQPIVSRGMSGVCSWRK